MKLIIVSGRSGSGKSTALHVLEDLGFYCIDNLPIGLLSPLIQEAAAQTSPGRLKKMAVSIDARNLSDDIVNFEDIYQQLQHAGMTIEIIFLDATEQSL
ncbi:MAG TPA: RNase adapter RapZ, partial [Marinobacter sp.]